MEIRKFRSEYNLELIPASHAGIHLGDLVWDPILGPPEFSRKGMPNTMATAFLDSGLLTQQEWEAMRNENANTPLIEAHFATRNVEVMVEFIQELQHPKIGELGASMQLDHLMKFSFSNLQMREMDDLMRVRIDQLLEKMKASRWKEYDGSIRRVFMITELYYGSLRLLIEKTYAASLDTLIREAHLELSSKAEGGHAVEYEFAHDQVPFAMRIEKVRNFNG